VFLMDEPLANLDAKLRVHMRTQLQELHRELDTTIIYVTHNQEEAMTMSSRIAVMNEGELQQFDEPLECYYHPKNRFVAGFIGSPSMNFFDVELDTSGQTPALVHDGFRYELDEEIYADIEGQGDQFTLGVRPEDIETVPDDTTNAISVPVEVTEPLGDVTYTYLDIAGEQYTATLEGDIVIDPGYEINVRFPQDRIHVFDGRTGEALRNREPPEEVDMESLASLTDGQGVGVSAE